MRDRLDAAIDGALKDIINKPACPGDALTRRVRKAAEARMKRKRAAALIMAGAALTLNAALVFLLTLTVVKLAGGGWVSMLAVLIGLSLAMLPAVPLLAIGDIPAFMYQRRFEGMEK